MTGGTNAVRDVGPSSRTAVEGRRNVVMIALGTLRLRLVTWL